jgi:hypothetical protein
MTFNDILTPLGCVRLFIHLLALVGIAGIMRCMS